MEKPNFDQAVKIIAGEDRRYRSDGYHFLREALDHTVNSLRKDELVEHRHVSGSELLEGLVEYAHKEFGSMALTVLDSWGIRSDEDVGEMVFNLIDAGAFGRSEEDSPEDFRGVLDLREALLAPYRPTRCVLGSTGSTGETGSSARGNQPAKSGEV